MDWRHRGACTGEDPDLFFPKGRETSPTYQLGVQEAKRICWRCPVRVQCLQWALASGQEGVWGGTSDEERRGLRADRRENRRKLAELLGVDEQELVDA